MYGIRQLVRDGRQGRFYAHQFLRREPAKAYPIHETPLQGRQGLIQGSVVTKDLQCAHRPTAILDTRLLPQGLHRLERMER